MVLFIAVVVAVWVFFAEQKYFRKHWDQGLEVHLKFDRRGGDAGQRCRLEETVVNDKRMPLPSLQVKFQTSATFLFEQDGNASVTDHYYRTDLFAAGGRRRITRTLEFIPSRRGYYEINTVDLLARDFFYAQTCSGRRENLTGLYVYPRKRDVSRFDILYRRMQGELLAQKRLEEDPYAFRGMREYRPTDSMRRINWKSTAKAGKLLVNMYESSFSQEICILLDGSCRNEGHKRQLQEMAISVASSLAAELLRRGIPVSLQSNMADILSGTQICCNAGNHRNHLDVLDTQLALADVGQLICPFDEVLKNIGNSGDVQRCYLIVSANEPRYVLPVAESQRGDGKPLYGIFICRENERKEVPEGFLCWEVSV